MWAVSARPENFSQSTPKCLIGPGPQQNSGPARVLVAVPAALADTLHTL